MNAGLNDRDWELLSAYLDSSLTPAETREVEARLIEEPQFNAAYESLRRTRTILRAVPAVKRRRNFYVTPQMVGQKKWTWLIPVFNYSSLATGLVAVILMVMNLLPVEMRSAPVPQAIMPAPLMLEASAPDAGNLPSQPAAPAAEAKQEISTQPVVEKDTQTQADQAAGPVVELAAPAPSTGDVSGEQPQPLPTTSVENFVAPAPPAAAPMVEGENEPAAAAPEMKAAGGGMAFEPTEGITIAGAAPENGMERKVLAPTMTMELPMETTPLEITETPAPTMGMQAAAIPEWTIELSTTTPEASPVSSPAAHMFVEVSPTAEAGLLLASSPTAFLSVPEAPVAPVKSQPTPGGITGSTGWMGGILLLVSAMLGFIGFILKKRLR